MNTATGSDGPDATINQKGGLPMGSRQRTGSRYFIPINRTRLKLYLTYCLALIPLLFWALANIPDSSRPGALLLAFAIGAVVPSCIIFRAELDLIEPVYWFSLMYYAFFFGGVYFIITDFSNADHNMIVNPVERNSVLMKALTLALVGYIAFLLGYFNATRNSQAMRIKPVNSHIPDSLLYLTILALAAMGSVSFLLIVLSYPGGLSGYYADIGLRANRMLFFGESVSTAGFQFIFAAMWLWMYMIVIRSHRNIQLSRSHYIAFALFIFYSIAVVISQGRLFQITSFCLVVAGMLYVNSKSKRRNTLLIVGGGGLIAMGIGLFMVRLVSLLHYNQPELFNKLSVTELTQAFVLTLNRFVIDKGNVTDLTSLMNIIAYWEQDYSMLYGQSFLSPISRFVPGTEFAAIAETTQAKWSTGVGAWPPTFVGELYANFGSAGVVAGMLVAGFIAGRVYMYCVKGASFWHALLICALTFRFYFVLPKGETVNVVGAIWIFGPVLIVFLLLKLLSMAARQSRLDKQVT